MGLYISTLPAALVWSGQRRDRRTDFVLTAGSGLLWTWGPSSQQISGGWRIDHAAAAFDWPNIAWLPRFSSSPRGWALRLPLWPPILISAITAAILWYRDRPAPSPATARAATTT